MIKDLSFISGRSEVGSKMQNINWSEKNLPPAEHWPQSLQTTISIVLNINAPALFIYGSKELCFFNDAFYNTFLSGKINLFAAIGEPAATVLSDQTYLLNTVRHIYHVGIGTYEQDVLLPLQASFDQPKTY